jgi:hypothetical protein
VYIVRGTWKLTGVDILCYEDAGRRLYTPCYGQP